MAAEAPDAGVRGCVKRRDRTTDPNPAGGEPSAAALQRMVGRFTSALTGPPSCWHGAGVWLIHHHHQLSRGRRRTYAGELKTFFPYFFWSRIRTEIRDFFWPWPWRISRISVRVSVLAVVGEN